MRHPAAGIALIVSACGSSRPNTSASDPSANATSDDSRSQTFPPPNGDPVPPEVTGMLEAADCKPQLRVALDQHRLEVKGDDGTAQTAFLIAPGEKLCLLGTPSGSAIREIQLAPDTVALAAAKQRLVSVELKVLDIGAVLVVRHHYDRALRYRVVMKAPGRQPKPTSVCPVMPGLAGLEHWPHAIDVIMFGDFRFLEPHEPRDCR